jgi:hypothetical protein
MNKIILTFSLTYLFAGLLFSQKEASLWHISNNIHRFFVGTGDHSGWKTGIGIGYRFKERFSLELMANMWTVTNYGDLPLFKSIDGYPTIDIYPENYPFPELLIPHSELTKYGVKSYTPQNNFWESKCLDLYLNYLLLKKNRTNIFLGVGPSIIKTNYTHLNEEWSGSVYPDWDSDTEYKVRYLVPLYVRYLDLGGIVDINFCYKFKNSFYLGLNLKTYIYTSSTNFTYGLNLLYKI